MAKIVNNIEIAERIYDSHMDLYAVFGRAIHADPEPFILAWQKRGKKKLRDIERFSDEKSALEAFQEAITGEASPEHKAFHRDDQKEKVYAWEDASIYAFAKKINKTQARNLLQTVCNDVNICLPKLTFVSGNKDDDLNEYLEETHTIRLKDMDDMTLLHEIAHAIVSERCKELGREHIAHAPKFVWTVMDLYRDYMNIDAQYMIIGAQSNGLLGDIKAQQFIEPQRPN